ncbi:MAG: hypothetical protein ACRD08_10665, partial [Acidimicrobiales bacterium]
MKTTVLEDEVEDRLRRTFHARSDDMAPGDGMAWDPTRAHRLTYVGGAVGSPRRRGALTLCRALAIAAATLVAGGAAGAVLLVRELGRETLDVRESPTDATVGEPPDTTQPNPTTTTRPDGRLSTPQAGTPDPKSYFRYRR